MLTAFTTSTAYMPCDSPDVCSTSVVRSVPVGKLATSGSRAERDCVVCLQTRAAYERTDTLIVGEDERVRAVAL